MIPIFLIVIPAISGLITLFSRKFSFSALVTIASGVTVVILTWIWVLSGLALGSPSFIENDSLSRFFIVIISSVGLVSFVFSFGYMRSRLTSVLRIRRYWVSINLFFASMILIPLMSDLILMWIAIELTTLFSILLVRENGSKAASGAAWKYAILALTGSAIALFGLLILDGCESHVGVSSFTWQHLATSIGHLPVIPTRLAIVFILIGFGTKVGLVPLHTWLPDAYSQAPIPVCALLSAGEATAVMGVLLRIIFIASPVAKLQVDTWFIVFGILTLGTASFLLVQVHDLKRMFAYSTIEQMGLMLVAGGIGTHLSRQAALILLIGQAFIKAACFFTAGSIITICGTSKLDKMNGLIRSNWGIAFLFSLSGIMIAGLPPFLIFVGEFEVLRSSFLQTSYVVAAFVTVFLIISFAAITRAIYPILLGKKPEVVVSPEPIKNVSTRILKFDQSVLLTVTIMTIAVIGISGLLLPHVILNLINKV
jgi:hydrogenase-4 component F